ncbi:MAG: hypothetical protein ACYCTY_13030 [Sulfuricella sp.]
MTGRLGQRHADLVEAMLYHAEKRRSVGDSIELLVDPARIRQTMGKNYSYGQIWKLIGEVRQANVEIDTEQIKVLGGLIEHVIKTKTTRANPLGGERHLWTVRLGLPLCELLLLDVAKFYNPGPIARLENGISQAVARHVLSHQTQPRGGWLLDGLISIVAGELTPGCMRDKRREVREDAELLGKIGIKIAGDRVSVGHPPDSVGHPPDSVGHPPDVSRFFRLIRGGTDRPLTGRSGLDSDSLSKP